MIKNFFPFPTSLLPVFCLVSNMPKNKIITEDRMYTQKKERYQKQQTFVCQIKNFFVKFLLVILSIGPCVCFFIDINDYKLLHHVIIKAN